MAIMQEKTGSLGELSLKLNTNFDELNQVATQIERTEINSHDLFACKVSDSMVAIIEKAQAIMERYKQTFLNEGHVINALFSLNNEIYNFFSQEDKALILDITTTSRDLTVSLVRYEEVSQEHMNFELKRAESYDFEGVYNFVLTEFNQGWANNIKKGFNMENIPIYIATLDDEIIGFGAYDLIGKSLFRPMGIKKDNRTKQVGYSILHSCLKDMKSIGYKYAIISEAGPIEFYEKSCGAVLIYKGI